MKSLASTILGCSLAVPGVLYTPRLVLDQYRSYLPAWGSLYCQPSPFFNSDHCELGSRLVQMAESLLSELHADSHNWTICVLVSRLWQYRGGTDEGAIKHTDMVLLDTQGNHMYGQIPTTSAERFKDVLEEGKVYVITRFLCNRSKTAFRPVEARYMVQFTRYTVVEPRPGLENAFPLCTYALTAFKDLPRPAAAPERFVDVIGRITDVTDVIPVQSMYQATPSDTRTIMLEDVHGNEMRLVLWGERAVEFNGDMVREVGQKEHVIAIFVGTLPKTARGVRSLSGSSACRWYINEDIPDIISFRSSIGDRFVPMAPYVPGRADALTSRVQDEPIPKTVEELNNLNPFVDMDKRFVCTVTVDRLGSDQRWWFPSCLTCRKSAKYTGHPYTCSDDACTSVDADLTYCISIFATDGNAEAEFVLFDKVAAGAVGKSLIGILRQRYPGYAKVDDMANVARHDTAIPPEITRLVGQKFRLMVSISKKWKFKNSDNLSFQVNRIEETYKPELPPLVLTAAPGSTGASSSAVGSGSQLPPLGPVMSPGSSTPPAPVFSGTKAHTPPSSVVRVAPSTPSPMSSAPKRSTKRSLFSTPKKNKEQADATDDAPLGSVVGEAVDEAEDKDTENLPLKTKPTAEEKDSDSLNAKKRGGGGGKSGSALKKNKQ